MSSVAAHYFDGKTSRLHHVLLTVQDGVAHMQGEGMDPVHRSCSLEQLHLSERSAHAPRKVTFPDGAFMEISDHALFNSMLVSTGYRDSWVVRLQQSWRGSLLALGGTLAILALAYTFGLPLASRSLAFALPVSMERRLGDGVLDYLDQHFFQVSSLSMERQQALRGRFLGMQPARPDSPAYRLLFRKSKIGPNAFALPSGDIVLTDEIIALMDNDDAVMGVLAHELGHLHERHLTRRIIQSSAIAAAATLIFGDVSAVIANIPTLMLDLKYSRDAESEADDYALLMLDKNGIAREHLAGAFEKLDKLSPNITPYLSSHPSGAQRAMRIRGNDSGAKK